MKRVEVFFKFIARSFAIAYLIGLMSFLGSELHAREHREPADSEDDAIQVPYNERLKALDTLLNAGIKRQLLDLRVELASLRRQVDVLKWEGTHDSRGEGKYSRRRRHDVELDTQIAATEEEDSPRPSYSVDRD
ncbi:MAG: hypothetical protein HY074_13650 [Deltaproteobacteria bacterium]|nr:hypothetical protein [Deltaproteobacteria bacterium]